MYQKQMQEDSPGGRLSLSHNPGRVEAATRHVRRCMRDTAHNAGKMCMLSLLLKER